MFLLARFSARRLEFFIFPHISKLTTIRRKTMDIIKNIALFLTVIGALNWGLIGFFDFNLVTSLFGSASDNMIARIIYSIIAIAGIINIGLFFED